MRTHGPSMAGVKRGEGRGRGRGPAAAGLEGRGGEAAAADGGEGGVSKMSLRRRRDGSL